MLELLSSTKDLKSQTPSEKIYILKLIAHQMLGAKWVYYRKIKHAGEGFKLFREKSLMEQMKATQAALRFTSKHTKKLYRTAYRNSISDIKRFTLFKTEDFPELEEVQSANSEPPTLGPEHDEAIITWTPIKFMLPARIIREKGVATQPHSEGLVAKLFFKVVGYYANPDNWEKEKLTIYLRKIDQDSSYHEVSTALAPLKDDLLKFSEMYVPFKFGKASLVKGKTSDEGSFEDDLGESFEDQLQTLYWYQFIYSGMEHFLLRYYLTLASSTSSDNAVRVLTQIFKPALLKAIENNSIFQGSFETDIAKRKYRNAYREFRREKTKEPPKKKIKTKQGIFEVHSYNLKMLENLDFGFELNAPPIEDSSWGQFIDYDLMDGSYYHLEKGSLRSDPVPRPTIEYVMMHILSILIVCTQYKRRAKHKNLELFKKRVEGDKEMAEKRISEIRKQGEKQIRQLERKVTKLRRMEQKESVEVYRKDIAMFRKRLEERCASIIETSQQEIKLQKRRLQAMFQEISEERNINEGIAAKHLLELVVKVSPWGDFMRDFTKLIGKKIQNEYETDLEPLYENLFTILEPSVQEKVILIQSLDKSGEEGSVKLSLTDEEHEENQKIVNLLKLRIRKGMPHIFICKVIFQTSLIPIEDLFKLSIDNESLRVMLRLKITSKKNSKPFNLKESIVKMLMVLNLVSNPVPKNNLIQEGREHVKDPQQVINAAMLNQLLEETIDVSV